MGAGTSPARRAPIVEPGGIGIRQQFYDLAPAAPRLLHRMHDERPADALSVNGRFYPDVFEVPAIAAILERAHAEDPAGALGDPDIMHLEIPGKDRQLRIPLAHPRGGVLPVSLRAVREVRQRFSVGGRGAPDQTLGGNHGGQTPRRR